MKFLKKSLLTAFLILVSVVAIMGLAGQQPKASASAAFEDLNFSKFISFSGSGNLTENNISKIDDQNYSIVSNGTISMALNLFAYEFTFDENLADLAEFNVSFSKPIVLSDDTGELLFKFNNLTYHYYYSVSVGNLMLYSSQPTSSTPPKHVINQNNPKNGFLFNSNRELSYITRITCTMQNSSTLLKLKVYDGYNRDYNFKFIRPTTKFANQEQPIVNFLCKGQDAGESVDGYTQKWLPSERTYKSVTVKFFKNYTPDNPLFFNVNQNGFTYLYQIFMRDGYLILKYIDGETTLEKAYSVFGYTLAESNTFDITFSDIGRYEIEIYDRTYNPNLTAEENAHAEANYYKTSFYIYDNSKTYENIYLVAEGYENGQPTEYLVSNSSGTATVNTDIRATFKNLYHLTREQFENIKIEVTKTLFTGSINSQVTSYTSATSEFMKECFDNQNDFYIDFVDDARYKINVYYGASKTPILTSSYEVVKQPKTIFQVGNEGDPYYDRYVETQPYTKTEKTYKVPLQSEISLNISYKNTDNEQFTETKANSTFQKTYLNEFTIFFGIAEVNIYKYTRMVSDGGEAKPASTLDIQIDAVGKITVTISRGGEVISTQEFEEFEPKQLSFSEYGEYQIHVVDEMGTTATASFTYQKGLNTSAIALIALSAILILAIVIFVMRSRAKVGTR